MCACGLLIQPPSFATANYGAPRGEGRGKSSPFVSRRMGHAKNQMLKLEPLAPYGGPLVKWQLSGRFTVQPLHRLTSWIRDYTQDPRHGTRLMSDEFSWFQLCTALDTVDDTEEAMTAYVDNDFPIGNGERYLRYYGVLQAMFVQQDSLDDLIKAVHPVAEISVKDILKDVREARNKSVGHPTNLKRGGVLFTQAIVQNSMRKDGFRLISYPERNGQLFQFIPVIELIAKQKDEAARVLSEVIEDLRQREETHRSEFRDVKLRSALDQVTYAFEKIFEELRKDSVRALSGWAVGHLRTALDRFHELLSDRGLTKDSYDSIKYLYLDIEHPLVQLTRYFSKEPSEIMSDQSAVVFAGALQGYFDRLRAIAVEVDEEYSSVPEGVSI
jgi:hypothetical protein